LQKSDLILLAARPSMGKTALALNMAMNAALEKNIVAVFSLEMSKEQLGHRLLSSYSGINSQKLSTGNFDDTEFNELVDTLNYLTESKLFIDDTAGITVLELRSKARKIKNEHGLDLIVIDYLQLMQGSSRKGSDFNRQQEISEISRSLKALARELKVPILALSQLSRSVELRADKRPLLSDLRESGSLEQDADIVAFLYREDYYDKESENANTAELVISKNRNGPTAIINLQFNKECMRFGSLGTAEE
jgi:replicative DNA helicase